MFVVSVWGLLVATTHIPLNSFSSSLFLCLKSSSFIVILIIRVSLSFRQRKEPSIISALPIRYRSPGGPREEERVKGIADLPWFDLDPLYGKEGPALHV